MRKAQASAASDRRSGSCFGELGHRVEAAQLEAVLREHVPRVERTTVDHADGVLHDCTALGARRPR